MKTTCFAAGFVAVFAAAACVKAADVPTAASRASTDQLPAALRALGADSSNILSRGEASAIRGEGGMKHGHAKRGGGNVNFAGVKNHHNAIVIDTSGGGYGGGGGAVNFAGVKNHHNAIIIDTSGGGYGSGGGAVNFAGVKNHHNSIIIDTSGGGYGGGGGVNFSGVKNHHNSFIFKTGR